MPQRLAIRTPAQECLVDITGEVREAVQSSGIAEGTAVKLDLEARGELHRRAVRGRHNVTVAKPALVPEEHR